MISKNKKKDVASSSPKLTLGPLQYNWPAEKKRDFYFRIADEADVDTVYLGETVCFKREPFFEPYLEMVTERLEKAGKEIVFSTFAVIARQKEVETVKSRAGTRFAVEANDVAAIRLLEGKPFVVGPFINVFNEGARDYLLSKGASRIVLSPEISGVTMAQLAKGAKGVSFEVQVFGRQPLAVATRCYHARAYGRGKEGCQFACAADPDGLPVDTLDEEGLLSISGTEVLSHGYVALLDEMRALSKAGIGYFRLSPQDRVDMVSVLSLYRDVLLERTGQKEALARLQEWMPGIDFLDGFYKGLKGMAIRELA